MKNGIENGKRYVEDEKKGIIEKIYLSAGQLVRTLTRDLLSSLMKRTHPAENLQSSLERTSLLKIDLAEMLKASEGVQDQTQRDAMKQRKKIGQLKEEIDSLHIVLGELVKFGRQLDPKKCAAKANRALSRVRELVPEKYIENDK